MKKKYIYSSSSGEERENQVVTKIKQVDYHNYLLGNILNFKHINNADEFKTKLGLILHNLADRLFKSSIINNTYQNIKATKLSLNTEKYNKILDDIKTVFNKQLNQLFINYNKENPIIDDDYIDLFNFIFDRNLKLPQTFILKDTITIANVREILLKELQNSTINLKPLFKNPLEINSTFNNVGEILSYSKLNTRNIKNTLKYIKIQEANNYNSSTVYKISNSQLEVFTDIHILHYKTSNVQTEKFGFGTYKEIFQEISNNEPYKKNIIKRIFEVVQNKEHDNLIELPKKLNNFAEQLTHLLFIIEMQRNNATLFTAPIFLELVAQDSKYLKTDFFPMATHTAVSQARGIAYSYPLELPNSYFMDYDTHNVTQGNLLLRQEGHVFVEWLQKVMGNDKLNNITQIFNLIYTKKVLQEKEIDSIKLQEIQAFLGSIGKLKNYPANLIKVLEENLHNLIPHFGSRPEQYLLLFKEALLKKTIFSKKVKDLIENTFFEFQKILPKLDSFLVKVQADLKKDIKKIIPEILQILCAKIKEWYNIDAPEYITNVKTVEELKNKEVLKDITAKINNSNSIFSQSGDKLKFSIPPIKRKLVSTENINNKLLKTHNEENYDSSLDDAIKEYYKIMGEDSSSISL